MRVGTRSWDEERLRIKHGGHRSIKPATIQLAEAGGLTWPQEPEEGTHRTR